MIQLNDRLYVVIVPEEATKFKISGANYLCFKTANLPMWHVAYNNSLSITGFEKFKILGTLTADEIEISDPFENWKGWIHHKYAFTYELEFLFKQWRCAKTNKLSPNQKLVILERL